MIDSKKVEITNANDEEYKRELLDSSYQRVKRLFVLTYDNAEGDNLVSVDSFKKSFLPTVKMQNYNIETDGRNFKDQSINDSIKKYDKVGKVWTGQSDDYTTGCLLDFTYFKNNYRLNAADLSKQKALDGDSRAIQQIIFTGNIKQKVENTKAIIYYFLEKMVEYSQVNLKLRDAQLKKLKTAVKNKTGTTLQMSLKMVDGNNMADDFLLTTRQKTKLRNAFNNNISCDLKLSRAQISKIIQSGGFLRSLLNKSVAPLIKVAILSGKNILAPLGITQLMQKFKRKHTAQEQRP